MRTIDNATIHFAGQTFEAQDIAYSTHEPDGPLPIPIENRTYTIECTLEQTPEQHAELLELLRRITPAKRWRKKRRIGVHCERWTIERHERHGARSWQRSARGCMRCAYGGHEVGVDTARRYPCQRPSERTRRFFAGQRRPVRRRLDTLNGRLVEELRRYGDARLVA